jgi:hypothetical protein
MRGPIDYIIVGFEGNKFDGSILKAVGDAIDKGIIGLIALAVITKDEEGTITRINIADLGDSYALNFAVKYQKNPASITSEDIDEMSDLLENNTSAGMLIVEQLWAKPLKKALLDANGVLIADGRIHPEAAEELNEKKEKTHARIA